MKKAINNTIITANTTIHTGNGSMQDGVMVIAINRANKATAPIIEAVVKKINRINSIYKKNGCRMEMGATAFLPIDEIEIPPYQETRYHANAPQIASDGVYQNEKEDVKKAFYNPITGKFGLVDGLGTLKIHKLMGVPDIEAKVFPLMTFEQSAILFANQYDGCTKVNTIQRHVANVMGKDEAACEIEEIINKKGLTHEIDSKHTLIRNINSFRKPNQIHQKYGKEGLEYAFDLIIDAGWADTDPRAFIEAALDIGFVAYKYAPVGSTEYNNLVRIMVVAETVNGFAAMAKAKFENNSMMHGAESSIKQYVRYLVNAISQDF